MLSLNEKMIRSGKSIGLPYKGSKKKISKKIVEIIKQNFGADKPIYDLFGGGGAITCELMLNGFDVVYNELDKSVVGMFEKALTADSDYLKSLIISREEFYSIREKEIKTVDDELKLLINSFGNNRTGYLYGADIADKKYNLAKKLLDNNQYKNYRQQALYKMQLERLEQLERLQRPLQITNKSYEDFSDVRGAVLYLDPPYEGTSGYGNKNPAREISPDIYDKMRQRLLKMPKGAVIIEDKIEYKLGTSPNNNRRMYVKDLQIRDNAFDSQVFYDWAFKMARHNIVLISSYTIFDNRFSVAHEFPTVKSTLQGGGGQGECEKLFMPIWQLEEYTSEQLTLF